MPQDVVQTGMLPISLQAAPTQVLDAQGIGVPIRICKTFAADATSVAVFSSDCPYKIRITGVEVHVTTKAAQTLTLNNGANAITNAITLNPTDNNSKVAAGTINPARYEVAKGGSLTGALSAAGGAGMLIIDAVKVAQ